MVKCFDLGRDRERFFEYVKLLGTQKYPGLAVQEFQWSAADHFEIRTFWIRGEFTYAIGTKSMIHSARGAEDEDCLEIIEITTFDDVKMKNGEYGKMDQYVKEQVIDIGRQVVTLPIFDKEFMIRIDFMRADSGQYVVNEVEACWSRIFPENIDKVGEMAEAFVALNVSCA